MEAWEAIQPLPIAVVLKLPSPHALPALCSARRPRVGLPDCERPQQGSGQIDGQARDGASHERQSAVAHRCCFDASLLPHHLFVVVEVVRPPGTFI